MTTVGVIFPPDQPPEQLQATARAADDSGLAQLWLWEDCFKESGITAAAAALAWTERLTVGIGLLPVPLRNVALTAMELATMQRLFSGRLVAGIGHGVLDWMEQVGARAESPMTLLAEYTAALRALLGGERVTTAGRYVRLTNVALDWPPLPPPPLLVGAIKPRTVALAAELADGVIFTGGTTPGDLRLALASFTSARTSAAPAEVVVFLSVASGSTAADIADQVNQLADAGATNVPVLLLGDDGAPSRSELQPFVRLLADDVRPLVG